jgi:2-methylisocitrate lyase-like PEP mutase family enzyme
VKTLAVAGSPPVAPLQGFGAARVSGGSGPMRATMGPMRRMAEELRDSGTSASMPEGALPYAEANQLLR